MSEWAFAFGRILIVAMASQFMKATQGLGVGDWQFWGFWMFFLWCFMAYEAVGKRRLPSPPKGGE